MWHLLLPLTVLLLTVSAQTDPLSSDRIYLKFPSSYANFTSNSWKLKESDDQFILAVNFKSDSHIGQIYRVRFLQPNGSVEAQLYVGLSEGFLIIDLLNSENRQILIKPLENIPINVHEHSLAIGLNTTSRKLWYRLGSSDDVYYEMDKPIRIAGTESVVTVGGGVRSMIGCVSIVAVSAGSNPPDSRGIPIGFQDIDMCDAKDACTTRDCSTGRCKLLEVPTCDCYGTEMTGPNCRRPASTVQLRNNDENDEASAYLRYTPWEPDQYVSRIAMDFKFSDVDAKEGILVYGETTEGQIFKIYVVGTKGNVVLGDENLMEFDLRTDDSQFHSIIVRFTNETFNLFVDEVVQRRHFNETLFFSTIQFGAPIPTDVSEVGVTACVKNIYVDHYDIIDMNAYYNDSRVLTTKVRPCGEEDFPMDGAKMFSADPVVELTREPEINEPRLKVPFIERIDGANLFPAPQKSKKPHPPSSSSNCDKPNTYMCQNESTCKKVSETEFTCYCRDGYIGKYCQFTTLPRSCAEARDFLKLPNGPTWVDVDGNRKLDPSVTSCIDGVTNIPHDMPVGTVVRDNGFQNHSHFILSYRDFNTWQLAKYIKNSGSCSQTINYRCNKAPLKFKEGKTWFKSVSNSTNKIRQIGKLENSCPCLDTGCQSGGVYTRFGHFSKNGEDEVKNQKCNCDSGAISEDIGELVGKNAGIWEVVTLFDEADVRAEMTVSDLKCSGYENEKPIRFTQRRELQVADWTGESIDLQFRTSDTPATLLTVRGNYGEKIIQVSLLDGHTVQISNFEVLKTISSQNKLNDSNWHHLLVELADGEIRITVDAAHVLMKIGDTAVLEGSVVLGGQEGFIGCIRNVLVNDDSLDLHKILEASENKEGITTSCDSHCTPDFCQNGAKCYEDFTVGQAYCRCAFPDVHSGLNCEIDINENSSVSFHGGHLKFDNLSTVLTAPVYFSFRTDRTHALLFFAHDQNNNFVQVHLSEEVNLTLTLNNLDIVSQCTVRAQPGTEFGDMRWIQVAISHESDSSQLQVDDAACTIRSTRMLSSLPILRLHDVRNSEIVRLPVGLAAPINPDPYSFTFIGNVDLGSKTNDGSFLLAPKYESPIPRFYGCIRGLQIDRKMVDMREKVRILKTKEGYEAYGPADVHVGCEVGCSSISCANGGHCSVAWTNTDPSATKTTCDCTRTSYAGATCSLDEGVRIERNGYIEYDISKQMSVIYVDRNPKIPQIMKFAFSAPKSDIPLDDKDVVASVTFKETRKLEIEINPNRTINVAITYENGKTEVLNFVGDFLDGFRHFVVVQTNQASATAVMIDSLRQDFEYRADDKNIDMFSAQTVRIGYKIGNPPAYTKSGFEGCVSNFVIDYQRGSSLTFRPISYFANPSHNYHKHIEAAGAILGGCADFEVPNSLPVYQNRVKFPIWETVFKRYIYHGEIESPDDNGENTDWTTEDSGSLLWIFFIIVLLALVFLLIFFIFMKCCREKIHAREGYIHDEDVPLNMTPTILRHPQPSPPPQKQSAVSNYRIPNPNVDFNKENVYDEEEEDEDSVVNVTIRDENEDSDEDTIRHIDDDVQEEDGMVVVSRPTQVNHLPQRVSSFRTGDPTAPKDSPLYSSPKKPIHPIPVPPPRMTPSQVSSI